MQLTFFEKLKEAALFLLFALPALPLAAQTGSADENPFNSTQKYFDALIYNAWGAVKSIKTNKGVTNFTADGRELTANGRLRNIAGNSEYDEYGCLTAYSDGIENEYEYVYFEKTKQLRVKSHAMAMLSSYILRELEYDDCGRLLSETISNTYGKETKRVFYDVVYDDHNNWVERKSKADGEVVADRREITYYHRGFAVDGGSPAQASKPAKSGTLATGGTVGAAELDGILKADRNFTSALPPRGNDRGATSLVGFIGGIKQLRCTKSLKALKEGLAEAKVGYSIKETKSSSSTNYRIVLADGGRSAFHGKPFSFVVFELEKPKAGGASAWKSLSYEIDFTPEELEQNADCAASLVATFAQELSDSNLYDITVQRDSWEGNNKPVLVAKGEGRIVIVKYWPKKVNILVYNADSISFTDTKPAKKFS